MEKWHIPRVNKRAKIGFHQFASCSSQKKLIGIVIGAVCTYFDIGGVDKFSKAYMIGEVAGFVNGLAIGWAQGTKAASKAASPNNWSNFSHRLFPKCFWKQFDNSFADWMNQVGD
jgi:hypothetical protein